MSHNPVGAACAPLTASQQRLFEAFLSHLASRGVREPREADFQSFGSVSRLQLLHAALAVAAPTWCAECRLATSAKRAEDWRRSRDGVPRRTAGPVATLSVPAADLRRPWARALGDMRAARRDIDRGVMTLEDREPPAASVIRSVEQTLRRLVFEARRAGLEPALDVACLRALLAGLARRECVAATRAARLKEVLLFAAWIGEDAAVEPMRREMARQQRLAARARKRKELWLLKTRKTVADCWITAEKLLSQGCAMRPGLKRRRLLLDALAIAFAVAYPLRSGDLHRVRIGVDLVLRRGVWTFEITTAKTRGEYDAGEIWPELRPFIEAVILEGRDPFDLAARVKAMEGAPLFSMNGVRAFSQGWISTVWRRHIGTGEQIIRTLWHGEAAEDGDTWMALALCGQGNARTAKHYTVKAARTQAASRGRALLSQARARRLANPASTADPPASRAGRNRPA